jgi:hypothetical protein
MDSTEVSSWTYQGLQIATRSWLLWVVTESSCFLQYVSFHSRPLWLRRLRRGSAGIACSNPAGGMNVSYVCLVLSGWGLSAELITHPEESYWVSYVWVWSWSLDNDESLAHWGLLRFGGGGFAFVLTLTSLVFIFLLAFRSSSSFILISLLSFYPFCCIIHVLW